MLHSIRYYHYYATSYCALICLLFQLQQPAFINTAAALTAIIDGATTSEWATRDEYQRLMEQAQPSALAGGPAGNELLLDQALLEAALAQGAAGASGGGAGGRNGVTGPMMATGPNRQQQQPQRPSLPPGQTARELAGSSRRPPPSTQQQQHQQQQQQQQQQALFGGAAAGPESAADEIQLALDRLELIEEEERQVERLRELKALERAMDSVAGRGALARLRPVSGARTLADLVPIGDTNLENPYERLKERGSSPQTYCGNKLIEALDLVCNGRFWDGGSEPKVVEPTIKTKRYLAGPHEWAPTGRKLAPAAAATATSATTAAGDAGQQHHNNNFQRSRQAKLLLYRRIRGANEDCCQQPCTIEEMEPYCAIVKH